MNPKPPAPRRLKPAIVVLVLALLAAGGVIAVSTDAIPLRKWLFRQAAYAGPLHTAAPRDIVITILESGNLESTNAKKISSEADGKMTILSLIPEGTVLTKDDATKGRILVRFEDEALREKATQQEITFQSASADYTQAKESYEIQKNQNESNIRAGQLTVKFARMDLARYLGDALAEDILKGTTPLAALILRDADIRKAAATLERLRLGGAARQIWKKLQSDIDLADEQVKRAWTNYEWSLKLGPPDPADPKSQGKGYIAQSDVEADRLQWKVRQAEAAQAKLAMDIFLRYDLPKEAEKLYSDHLEAKAELGRIHAKARAQLAQEESKKKSKEAAYNLQKGRLDKLNDQIGKCTIRARPGYTGTVVYASTTDRRGRAEDVIEEGASVRKGQLIIRIPDPKSMAIKIKVNEARINQVKSGQKAKVAAETFPEDPMWGTVKKVATTPDPVQWWLPADTRTYTVEITLDNPSPKLKTGMSAEVQIIVDRLEAVLAVPIQAVSLLEGVRVCYVTTGGIAVARPVEIGKANDNFIHITSGLAAGDRVLLYKPESCDNTEVLRAAAKRKAEAAVKQRQALREARPAPPGEQKSAPGGDAAADLSDNPEWIKKLPAERREKALARWRALSQEERKAMLSRMAAGKERPRRRRSESSQPQRERP